MEELWTMSTKELDRAAVMARLVEGSQTQQQPSAADEPARRRACAGSGALCRLRSHVGLREAVELVPRTAAPLVRCWFTSTTRPVR